MTAPRIPIIPLRWVAHLPLAILPFLAAAAVEGRAMERVLAARVTAALAAAGQDWARATVDGRDVEIRGLAPSAAALQGARMVVAGTFGVRRVVLRAGTAGP